MKEKDKFNSVTGQFVQKKKGTKTLKEFAGERGIKQSTIHKHVSGVRDLMVLLKYIDSPEELLEIFEKLKK